MRTSIAARFAVFALFATLASGCAAEATDGADDTSQAAFGTGGYRRPEPKDKLLQVRWLEMGWVGRHADVCVDDTCYTSGPVDGFYKRDRAGSAEALRNADGWGPDSNRQVSISASEARALKEFMNAQVTGLYDQGDWRRAIVNPALYLIGGACITFSNGYFNRMADMVSEWRDMGVNQ